ncbi:MAG: hypothetical protein H6621_00470 [Halobacteriovoraceae bacterium]|nr:hypothetical protein [Halobacteriovoraceae bacterium]
MQTQKHAHNPDFTIFVYPDRQYVEMGKVMTELLTTVDQISDFDSKRLAVEKTLMAFSKVFDTYKQYQKELQSIDEVKLKAPWVHARAIRNRELFREIEILVHELPRFAREASKQELVDQIEKMALLFKKREAHQNRTLFDSFYTEIGTMD